MQPAFPPRLPPSSSAPGGVIWSPGISQPSDPEVTTAQQQQATPAPPSPCQVEFILMGGTFMSLPTDYRDYFVRNLHDALSGHCSKDVGEAVRWVQGRVGGWMGVAGQGWGVAEVDGWKGKHI